MIKRQLDSDAEFVRTIGMVAEVYQELSAMKMRRVRQLVLRNREFLTGLSEIFADVKRADLNRVLKLSKKKQAKPPEFEKSAYVLLSPNGRLWGSIVLSVLRLFAKRVSQKVDADVMIVGKVGKAFFDKKYPDREYTYFDLDNNARNVSQLEPVLNALQKYDDVYIFHGLFESLYVQNPVASNVTGRPTEKSNHKNGPITKTGDHFAFEPAMEEIVGFFSAQVFSSLFKQSVHESQLARLASRTRAMDEVIDNVGQMKRGLHLQKKKIKKQVANKALVETISRFSVVSNAVL